MKHAFLLALNLCLAAAACARPDTVYVAHGAAHTPRVELADGHAIESRPMPGDTLTAGGVCFVRLPRLRLVLCIGQSNMAGRGLMDAGAADTLRSVYLFNGDGFERAAEPMNRYSTVRKELGMQRVGPVGSFAARYAEVTGAPVGVVVNARGGSSIDEWLPGSETGYLAKAVERIRAAGDWGDVAAVLWHQGEADSAHPERYEAKLRRLVGILRTELGNPSLPVVFGEIAHWNWTNRVEGTAPFNAMLRSLHIPHTACVSAEGLAPMKDETDPHFSAASQRELGRRYAEALLKLR
ncbi:sialate O-acetylesterase [Alistipes timonensis]|uniref:sialate O-acetylesterase n=1 Tax=Alistipes timonensis TaxID=1465754 RepID=UPI001C3D22EF|nr:sialate O-acetylesterase [Alistipes timonensis]MCR2031824.1 sialate O-acetylesterase [Alistipes timonensis]